MTASALPRGAENATSARSTAAHALRLLPLLLLSLLLGQAARPAASQSSAAPRRLLATETLGNPVYIVRLKENSVAAEIRGDGNNGNGRNGGGNGGANGRNGQRQKIDRNSQRVKDHVSRVKAQHARVARGAGVPDSDVLYSYAYSTNGLAARLSKEQKRALEADPEVAYVQESKIRKLDVLDSPNFLNLPNTLWKANKAAKLTAAGEGTVVGVVDTGIWPEHPSFQDQATNPYPDPPATWTGKCQTTSDFPKCTRKLIGAQYFIAGFLAAGLTYYDPRDWLSPRDLAGHGTWCAGAAAGNGPVSFGSLNSVSLGSSYGVAPRAFLAAYKVSWYSTKYNGRVITDSDILAAVDTAVADGVDVLSLSLGGMDPSDTYFDDLGYLDAHLVSFDSLPMSLSLSLGGTDLSDTYFDDLGYLDGHLAGVVVVKSASNYGPPPFHPSLYRSISNFSPFFLTVGASSISRRYNASLTLGNGTVIYGNGFGGLNMGANTPLIDAAKIPAAGYDASKAKYCKYGSLDTVWVAWRMVVCLYGGGVSNDEKAAEVARGKGLAVLIVSVMPADDASVTRYGTLPAMTLFPPNDAILNEYLLTASPTGTMSYGFTQTTTGTAATMAYFSSIGPLVLPSTVPPPSFPTNDILKPDIIAPGYNLWGAAIGTTPGAAMSTATKVLMSGTSMATPQVAGIAALIMQNQTDWTPSQVMSAIMTTAIVRNNKNAGIKNYNNSGATPWQMGAGHVDASKVLSPGLTYNLARQDFYNFLAGQNLTLTQGLAPADAVLNPIPAYNLNRPTISVGRLTGSLTVTRTVTSVGTAVSTYNATVVSPTGVTTVVTPKSFTIAPGESVTFNVTFTVVTAHNNFRFGSLTWKDGKSVVTSQIAVVPWSV